ncbi:YjbQ family protein [Clostridium sp. UBA1652]|uniref:YjbQ family protein n=1 Tax=Clostridium sp. UBA1652 TaxID=1946348 RepID=UPI00257CE7CC|nr:YjbQ family protein [Clostridium sp. UBA1652]
MSIYKEQISLTSHGETPSFFDITPQVRGAIKKSNIQNGICVVISPHTTCSVFFEEFVHDYTENGDEFLQVDLNDVLKKIIPDNVALGQYNYPGEEHYKAVESWPDALSYLPNGDRSALFNCDAHLKATLLGSSETFEVDNGDLGVGTTGYVYFVDFDRTRSRTRKCKIIIMGE